MPLLQRPETIRSLLSTIQHLLEAEGATLDTPVKFFADKEFLANPGKFGEPGGDGGRLLSLDLYDQLDGPKGGPHHVSLARITEEHELELD